MGEDAAIDSLVKGATDYVLKSKLERLIPAIKRVLYEKELLNDRVAADKALRESEEKYRHLVENIRDAIFEMDSEGKIKYVSPVIEKIMGYIPEELVGTYFINFVYEDDKQSIFERFSELHEKIESDHEYRCVKKSGDICWVRSSTKPIFENDLFKGGSGTLIDITRRKHYEEALLKEQYLMETLMNNIPDHLYFKDLESRFIRISKSNNESFRIQDTGEAIGKTDFDFFTEEHALAAYNDEQQIIKTGLPLIKEEKETWADRPDTWALSTKMPLRDKEGNIIGTFGISRDITERKHFEEQLLVAKEKAEASDRLKTAFIRNITHEILTPLNGMLGFGHILTDPSLSIEEKEEFLALVNSSSNRLVTTVNNIMDISLIVSGNQELNYTSFSPLRLLHEIKDKFSQSCTDKNLELIIANQPDAIELLIHSDMVILRKVISHLVDNAVKFTIQGSVTIGFTKMGNRVEFFVKDTGTGIDEETQKLMYEPFMQKDADLNRTHEGSGLGLAIVKGYIELMGGNIQVESKENVGSVFKFIIPV